MDTEKSYSIKQCNGKQEIKIAILILKLSILLNLKINEIIINILLYISIFLEIKKQIF